MGRIKTKLIKRITLDLYNKYKDEFKNTFEENKKIIEKLIDFPSKKIRNVVAGYITRLVKKSKE